MTVEKTFSPSIGIGASLQRLAFPLANSLQKTTQPCKNPFS